MDLATVSQIIELLKNGSENGEDVENKVVEFLSKLRSHQIIEIEGVDAFLE